MTQGGVNGYIGVLKAFYRQMNGLTSIDPAPEPIRHLRKEKAESFIRKEILLTDEEVDKIFVAAKAVKWKAILAVLMCGLRPGELRSLKIGDVTIDNECIKIRVAGGKMGGKLLPRTVFVKKGAAYLQAWFLEHPRRDDNNAFLFGKEMESIGFIPLGDSELRSALRRFAKKAGVKNKMICAYGFRHKVLTEWYTNPQLGYENARRLAGHRPGSKMSEIYCHVDDEGLKRAFYGSEKNKTCQKCGNINPTDAEYCSRCGFCFSTKKLIEKQQEIKYLAGNGLEALEYLINNKPNLLRNIIKKWKQQNRDE
jgi:integrase/ribosomal protein L40E